MPTREAEPTPSRSIPLGVCVITTARDGLALGIAPDKIVLLLEAGRDLSVW